MLYLNNDNPLTIINFTINDYPVTDALIQANVYDSLGNLVFGPIVLDYVIGTPCDYSGILPSEVTLVAGNIYTITFIASNYHYSATITQVAVLRSSDPIFDYYGSVEEGDLYFSTKLNSAWDCSDFLDKRKALITATQIIDRLNFIGCKATTTQVLQFPRGTDTNIPSDIKFATYEIANKLLDGVDPDLETDNLSVESHSYHPVRTTYNRTFLQVYMQAGVPSARAWAFLRPYLRTPAGIHLRRVN